MKHPEKVQPVASATAEPVAATTGGVNETHDSGLINSEVMVEYLSVADFIRTIPHSFHMDEVGRFGMKVGMIADGVHCSYKSRVDKFLGECRVFPVNLLKRVYEVVAQEKKWPAIVDVDQPVLTEEAVRAKACLRANERVEQRLQELIDEVESSSLIEALSVVRKWIEAQSNMLRAELNETPAIQPPAAPEEATPKA